MLKELSIKNFTIIENLHIRFSDGLTILSGETGAGKSIIINAVNFLLGSRASTKLIRTGAETAELEALFKITPESKAFKILDEQGYKASEELLIRRIISSGDRHRIYINGHLATIQMLSQATENLASISGQHAHQGLLKEDLQLMIIDQFGGLTPIRARIYSLFNEIVPLIQKLRKLNNIKDRQAEHINLLEFQKKEILDASIKPGEDASLEQERIRLKNGEELYRAVYSSIEELYSANGAIVERLVEVKKNLDRASEIDPDLSSKAKDLNEACFRIEDIAEELRTYLKIITLDDKHLEEVESRLDILTRFKRKYGGTLEAVIEHLKNIDLELSGIENISDQINDTETKLSELHGKLSKSALDLSSKRSQTAKLLAKKVEEELVSLRMSGTKFKISLQTIPASDKSDPNLVVNGNTITETGIDNATFLMAPNVGEDLKPMANIASGGELSRVVLALKAILAEKGSVETLVFDEVDAGIGGSVAEAVGRKLSNLARYHQIICITHLPQIAKFGDNHFSITKKVSQGRTTTSINPLNEKDRVKEIARMLGGMEITKTTLDHAREMLKT
ncbi:MAG: DNA repair protein RecN [Proteobacteria bacterium]|nr:DNA repair protein RecN [Desulfobacteraceae bacterium]MBU3979942.1 DNA repair protein RecN [Pseudomonadota bacterium]MBU4013988.1 DNA repair protein RecN [Pseudomonadota bacterium]MBU4069033.1 DNA repair protein RecN [Pseudomonadota bacterium]MBU4100256.1 DNA repair protein RecN [Pseudomonadota bacterium]